MESGFLQRKDKPMSIKPEVNQTFSNGTLNPLHLIEFAIPYIDPVSEKKLLKDIEITVFSEIDEDAAVLWNEEVIPYLDSIAPPNTYFGSTEGNGSELGWWKYEEEETI
jgi:hypothetical protein